MSVWGTALTLAWILLQTDSQILHSVSRMDTALQNQATLSQHLFDYLQLEHKRLQQLSLLMKQIQTTSIRKQMNDGELEETLSHPVTVLRLVTELYAETENIRLALQPSHMSEDLKSTLDLLPTAEDYTNALRAVGRLQDTYQEKADFTRQAIGEDRRNTLTAMEVFDIAKTALDDSTMHIALENMQRAMEMFREANDIPNAMLSLDYLAYLMHEQGNADYALNYTYTLLDYYETVETDEAVITRLQSNVDTYITELGGAEKAEEQVKLTEPYSNQAEGVFPNYSELCRGEKIQVEGIKVKRLSCYVMDKGHPLLLLAPAKVEELSSEAGLSYYHDVLTENEIKSLKNLAAEKFGDSELVIDEKNTTTSKDGGEKGEEEEEQQQNLDYHVRSSNTGWVEDDEDERVRAISRRVAAMTGLDLSYAEPFQVLSYGVGGFYLPHFDYSHVEGEQVEPDTGPERDRIATWIFYLNNVEQGGATVFPDIGATVWPEKGGAAFWYNLYQNGTGNKYTLHAACPVLKGYKWASNKWFHEGGNELARPCDLNESL